MSFWVKFLFVVGDILLLNISILLSQYLYEGGLSLDVSVIYLLVFSNLAWIFLIMVSTPYNVNKGWTLSRTIKSQFAFIFIHLLVVVSLGFFFRQTYGVFEIALIYLLFVPLFGFSRIAVFYLRKVFTSGVQHKYFVLIGRNDLSNEIRKYYLMNPDSGYKFQGYLDYEPGKFSMIDVEEFCAANEVHEIYCCSPDFDKNELQGLINFGLNSLIKVKVVVSVKPSNQSLQLDQFNQLPGLDIAAIALDDPRNQFIKRTFDLVFASLMFVTVMWWLILLIGILIRLDSPGPVFFVQLRSGRGNRPFKCFKFRTMVVNRDSDTTQASKNDTRITKLGQFLRKSSIDEMPQFINVLIGTMSVVGPRPHMLKHTDEYSKLIEIFLGRHYVKPGITGLAQCLGYRGETRDLVDMENRVRMDRFYIENWTFWFDFKIIFLTVVSLLRGSDKAF